MIYLASHCNDTELAVDAWAEAVAWLPARVREGLSGYWRWQDRQAGLYGKLLLRRVGQAATGRVPDLSQLRTDTYQRPSLADMPDFDFNISHTAGLVVCGGATGMGRLGVDVERIGAVDITEFRRVFTEGEYAYLSGLDEPAAEFFRLWTRKEAVMKADGRGFYLDPSGIDCLSERVSVGGVGYGVMPLDLGNAYAAHVAARSVEAVCMLG
ncbi:4'-phosphopantetheinyl transferase [Neolewinella xylanilytica]|uniref:4'-phosphopantetheinyl transferase n=1 Tax=Neolewinella xylanilytica TaxID=1514080 RepID=A0A2S6I262_9BACT|nr:4'-phosphopantetheinyl transferase superfamily protein [Neolewinella xylanilytica]PPK85265.1 4'-phosphopantetheinyl transferase [Neolewinella xylanilytica]